MRKIVRKIYIDFEKEEKWLNEMSEKGWQLVDYSWLTYTFVEGKRGEYTYRIELLQQLPSNQESKDYLQFMKDSGVECIGAHFRWVFFRKRADEGSFDLYTDYTSLIAHYKRIYMLYITVAIINLVFVIYNTIIFFTINQHTTFSLLLPLVNGGLFLILIPMILKCGRRIKGWKQKQVLFEQ